ncbi:MAG: hypothetical protein LUQ11_14840 [Methylococcaceae bacterium]|nr:hypothetical protein [Methylococcaceae bacterium]
MRVSNILINTGQASIERGFQNTRLPLRLGVYDEGEGKPFRYGLQVTFTLDGIATSDTRFIRRCTQCIKWTDPLQAGLSRLGLNSPEQVDVMTGDLGTADSPDQQNVIENGCRKIVFDAPGPTRSFVVENPICYPIIFRARFQLNLIHSQLNNPIGTAEYYIELTKQRIDGAVEGGFRVISLMKAELTADTFDTGDVRYTISKVDSNFDNMTL